jgi:thymidylate kinase
MQIKAWQIASLTLYSKLKQGTIVNKDLAITTRLIDTLNSRNIEYCHWKSNLTLGNALTGGEDLDVLVNRKQLHQFLIVLLEMGFKAAVIKSGANVPGIYHYYGLDEETGKVSHVHLYNSILSGESFVKSHFLPIERMLLEDPETFSNVHIVSKSAEMVLFVVRMFIKYGSPLDLIRLARHPEPVLTELRWLQSGSDLDTTLTLLDKYCPVIDKALFLKCIQALEEPNSLLKRVLLARTVRRKLRVYDKYSLLKWFIAYTGFLWVKPIQRLTGKRKNKTLNSGGAIIAFVGADATGKSTLVSESGRWLGSIFSVRKVHVGKPPSTWLTTPINILLPAMRHLFPHLRRSWVNDNTAVKEASTVSKDKDSQSLIFAIRAVALAWDRAQLLVKVRRWAANGDIIICDRYPTETVDAMDSPRLQERADRKGLKASFYNYLAGLESRIYKHMPPPDVVLRLKVSVETAKQRNRDRRDEVGMDDENYLEARHRQVSNWNKNGTKYYCDINTEMSLDETILSVKRAIWEVL